MLLESNLVLRVLAFEIVRRGGGQRLGVHGSVKNIFPSMLPNERARGLYQASQIRDDVLHNPFLLYIMLLL